MQVLLRRIRERRETVDAYVRNARPRAERLTNICIISSAVAAALTAGPGFGRTNFTDAVKDSLSLDSPDQVWVPICILASITSLVAAISANLSKSRNAEARIVSAEACRTELEGLETFVEFHQISLEQALKLYQQYIARVPFIGDEGTKKGRHAGSRH
jgi:hypothetical protein